MVLLPLVMAIFLSLASCSEPPAYEKFLGIPTYERENAFKYNLDMSDSLSTYEISFFTGLDCAEDDFAIMRDIQLDITMFSPSGKVYAETVYILKNNYYDSDNLSKSYNIKYRTGLIPKESGKWTMIVKLPYIDSYKGLRGLGLILEKQQN